MPDNAKRADQAETETGAVEEDNSPRPLFVGDIPISRLVSILHGASHSARLAYKHAEQIDIVDGRVNNRRRYTIMRVTETIGTSLEQTASLLLGEGDQLPDPPAPAPVTRKQDEVQKAVDRREAEKKQEEIAKDQRDQREVRRARESMLYMRLKDLQYWCKKNDMEVSHPKVVVDIEHILNYIREDEA